MCKKMCKVVPEDCAVVVAPAAPKKESSDKYEARNYYTSVIGDGYANANGVSSDGTTSANTYSLIPGVNALLAVSICTDTAGSVFATQIYNEAGSAANWDGVSPKTSPAPYSHAYSATEHRHWISRFATDGTGSGNYGGFDPMLTALNFHPSFGATNDVGNAVTNGAGYGALKFFGQNVFALKRGNATRCPQVLAFALTGAVNAVAYASFAFSLGANLDDLFIAPNGDMYVSDRGSASVGGKIYKIPYRPVGTTAALLGSGIEIFCTDASLSYDGALPIRPVGANGIVFDKEFKNMYVSNLANGSIIRVPIDDGVAGTASILAQHVNLKGADGMEIDIDGFLWVSNELLDSVVRIDTKTGATDFVASAAYPNLDNPTSLAMKSDTTDVKEMWVANGSVTRVHLFGGIDLLVPGFNHSSIGLLTWKK